MQARRDIFGLWPTFTALASDIDAKPDAVRKWGKFGRIPQEYWQSVIDAAARKGHPLTLEDILAFNAPMKRRGRPPAVANKRRRAEARAA